MCKVVVKVDFEEVVVRVFDFIFASDVTRPVTTESVSPDPPEILEAQPSQIEEVFVKISPPEDKPKVRPERGGQNKSCEILVYCSLLLSL